MSTQVAHPEAPVFPIRKPAFAERFRFIRPTLPPFETVTDLYEKVYLDGQITNSGLVGRFEAAAAERLGVRECVAVSSCTSGLMMVMRAYNLKGEVIMPSFTFFATGHAAAWNGLTPVFADCDPDNWTVDVASVESQITERTSAIVAVHLYGNPCRVANLQRLADRHGLKLIYDAAHGFGSRYQGCPVGQFGDAEIFSFSPTKLLVAGEGGLVSTNDKTLARLLRAARNYGDLGAYDPELLGLNARMSEFNAALALAGMNLVDRKLARHNEIAERYTAGLTGLPGVTFQQKDSADIHTYKDYSILVDPAKFGISRDVLARQLLADNIETKKYFYPPLHQQMLYAQYHKPEKCPLLQTERITGSVLSLPVYESLSNETVDGVTAAIRMVAEEAKNGAYSNVAYA